MEKIILGIVVCGGILIGFSNSLTVHAGDILSGKTEIGAEVVKGDITLSIDSSIDFEPEPLSATVDFGTKEIDYTVTDYSGTTNGYEIRAKLKDVDENRSLKIGDVELSDEEEAVVTKDTDTVGENKDKVTTKLVYNGVTKVQKYTSEIEWDLTNGSTKQISE